MEKTLTTLPGHMQSLELQNLEPQTRMMLQQKSKELGSQFNPKAALKAANALVAIQDMSITRPEDATKRADETTNLAVIENYLGFEYLAAVFTILSDSLGLKVFPSLWSTFYQMLKSDNMHLSMNVYDLKLAFQYGASGAYGSNYNTYNLERLMHWCYSYIESKQTKNHLNHESIKHGGSSFDLSSINPNVKAIGVHVPTDEEIQEAKDKMIEAGKKFQKGPYLSLKEYCVENQIDYRGFIDLKIHEWTTEQNKINPEVDIDLNSLMLSELHKINKKEGLIK